MSAQKRKSSEIYDHQPTTQEQAFQIMIDDLHIKNETFKTLYHKLLALPLHTPIDTALHHEINQTLREITKFFSECVLQNHYHPTLQVPSLQCLSTNATINHWNYSSIFTTNLHTVFSREEQTYKDLLKQTIISCMRIWRTMFAIDSVHDFHTSMLHDPESGLPNFLMQAVCTILCDIKLKDYEIRWNQRLIIQELCYVFQNLNYFMLITHAKVPFDKIHKNMWTSVNNEHPHLMHAFIPFLRDLNSKSGHLKASDLKRFLEDIAAPYVLHCAANVQNINTRNILQKYSSQLIRYAKFLDFIDSFKIFGDLCLQNEEKMEYCFSLLRDSAPDPRPLV